MTAGTTQLAAEMESYIRHTQESKGRTITVLKQAGLAAFERRRGLVRLPVHRLPCRRRCCCRVVCCHMGTFR